MPYKYTFIIKKCICGKEFKTYQFRLDEGKGKYCSRKCYSVNPKRIEMTRNMGLANKGRVHQYESRLNMGLSHRNEKHGNWLGDKAKYRAVHMWIQLRLGKANKCSNNISHKSTRYHWANISGEYKRDIIDWKELCPKCNLNDGVKIHPRFYQGGVSIFR